MQSIVCRQTWMQKTSYRKSFFALGAWRSWADFPGNSDAKTWLFRIARNYMYDLLRRKQRQRIYESKTGAPRDSVPLSTFIELEKALQQLSFTHRQVLNLRWIQDMTVEQSADILGWSESKVRVTCHRAIEKLRELLQDRSRKLTGFSGWDFQAVSDGKYAGIIYFPVMNDQPYRPLPDAFTLEVHVNQIGDVQGNWSFFFPVSEQKLQADTKSFHPSAAVQNGGYSMKIDDVSLNPVQMVIHSTMTIPANGTMPNRMAIIDNRGQVIGGGIDNQTVVKQTGWEKVVQLTITAKPPSSGATAFSITPIRDFSSDSGPLEAPYPKAVRILPGLQASVTGIAFHANSTVVNLQMNQAEYKRLTTSEGHSIEGQFFLNTQSATSSDSVGSKTVVFDSPNTATMTFGSVDGSKPWSLSKSFTVPQSGLTVKVPLK